MINIKKLNPFGKFCVTMGMIPTSYKESLTYEEQLLWFCGFLEKEVIPAVNNNADALIELQNYVKNYFDNLDVQEEINNKLDEMAEDGTLEEMITQYLQINGILGFDKISDLVSATNLIDGSICKTLGDSSYNDGLGAFYKIRTLINTDIVDGYNLIALTNYPTLVAERINKLNYKKIDRKIIMLGDSYGVAQFEDSPITKFFWEYFNEDLGLTENVNMFNGFLAGASFSNDGYLTKLQTLESSLNKKLITDIFIIGGFNDSGGNITEENILIHMNLINTYIKSNFPNANVTLAHIGYSNPKLFTSVPSNYNVINISKSIKAYKKGANSLGWSYINGIEYVLKNYDTSYWQEDGVHPSQYGQDAIAKYITEGYITKNVVIDESSSALGIEPTFGNNILSHSVNFKFINTINGLNEEVTMTQYSQTNFIRANDSITFNGNNAIEIGTLNLPYIYGFNIKSSTTVPIIVNNGTNAMAGTGQFNIIENKLYLIPLAYDSANSTWRTNNSDYIFFPSPKFNVESNWC